LHADADAVLPAAPVNREESDHSQIHLEQGIFEDK
jgi:hypothetical protein